MGDIEAAVGMTVTLAGSAQVSMVIVAIAGDDAECAWFNKQSEPRTEWFPIAALREWTEENGSATN